MTLAIALVALLCLWVAKQALGALVGQQVRGSIPEYTAHRARAAAQKLPVDLQQGFEEEWLAELATLDSKPLSAIRYSHGLGRAARQIARHAGLRPAGSKLAGVASRSMDAIAGVALVVLFSPLLCAISLAVRIEGSDRVFARSVELGKGGKVFHRLRFVTMGRAADGELGMTRLGRLLFRFSLHELPVLLNVLKGDMSFVGPPLRRLPSDRSSRVPLRVRPGILSWELLAAQGIVQISLDEARLRDEHRGLKNDVALFLRSTKAIVLAEDLAPPNR